jgi:ribonucleotide reductase beta subunit family protein with ferritin-like domain
MARMLTPKDTYTFDYPAAVQYANQQISVLWTHDEIDVTKDVQDLRVNMTEAEKHGVITTLKLFTIYELLVGNEYWLGRVKNTFPRPDIELMATTFGYVELGIHAQFYNKLNEALLLNTDEFYSSYVEDETLKARIDFVNEAADDDDILYSLGVFSMLEGAVLYSSFAFLKHFQAQGKNKLMNVCRGINFSVRDENLHAEAGAWLYRTLLQEKGLSNNERDALEGKIIEAAKHVYDHECRIIEMIFERGQIDGLDEEELKEFVRSRINLCLSNLGIEEVFNVGENPVANWFYKNINNLQFGDFFTGTGSEYNRNWEDEGFSW